MATKKTTGWESHREWAQEVYACMGPRGRKVNVGRQEFPCGTREERPAKIGGGTFLLGHMHCFGQNQKKFLKASNPENMIVKS